MHKIDYFTDSSIDIIYIHQEVLTIHRKISK